MYYDLAQLTIASVSRSHAQSAGKRLTQQATSLTPVVNASDAAHMSAFVFCVMSP